MFKLTNNNNDCNNNNHHIYLMCNNIQQKFNTLYCSNAIVMGV